jgi:hypothetical protein
MLFNVFYDKKLIIYHHDILFDNILNKFCKLIKRSFDYIVY